jgi:DHA2 family multidrug resistance protein-like MFS transporter
MVPAVTRHPQQLTAVQRWSVLVTVGVGLLLITLDNSILYTALPTLTEKLGASASESLWIINAYPVVMAGLLLGSGTLGDRIGHRTMFIIGLTIFGAASALAAFAPSSGVLIGARAVLAVGAAAMMPATLALIRISFTDERERSFAVAVWGSIAVIGMALGPIIGGTLLEFFWWGSVFLINVPVVVVALIVSLSIVPKGVPDPSKRWDLVSSLQVMVGLVGAVLAIKELAHQPVSWSVVVASVVASVVGFTAFARRQRRLERPLLEFAIFRNPAFAAGVVAAATTMLAIAGIQLVTTQRFQLVSGFTPLEAGMLVSAVAVGSLPTALLGGAFLHRVGLRLLIAGGLAVAVVGVAITVLVIDAGLGWMVGGLLITGAGMGAAVSVASSAIIGNVAAERAGMAASVEEVSYELGSLTGVAVIGSLVTAVYTATVTLPSGAPQAARESLPQALAVAQGDPVLIAAAHSAYDTAYAVVLVVVAIVLVAGSLATGWLLRGYGPGTASFADH